MRASLPWVVLCLLTGASGHAEEEAPPPARALRIVRGTFEHVGRRAPEEDTPLGEAASQLAQEALRETAGAVGDALHIASALSAAGGFDPSPRALILRSSPAEETLRVLATREDLAEAPASHLGVGFASNGQRGALVVLLAERRVLLDPFPRRSPLPPAESRPLCGRLYPGLDDAEVFVTDPSGAVHRPPIRVGGPSFCAKVSLSLRGRYTLEVLGHGARGPEVAALFFSDVGPQAHESGVAEAPEPATVADARRALLQRINALRAASGAPSLELDPALGAVAQAYSDQMAREHFFAHVAPTGANVTDRLRAAGYPYATAGENLGVASGPLAAHFGIEHSPGHRKNLLEPAFRSLGLGIAVEHLTGREQTVVTELYAAPLQASNDPLADAYRAVARRRAALKLPQLKRNTVLERLATEQARRALELDAPSTELPGRPLHEKVFALLPEVRRTSADLFVTEHPASLPGSKSLEDRHNDALGLGVVKGDSARFGKGRYWVFAIYAGTGR